MKCQKCGKKLKSNEKFCTICGYYNGEKESNDEWEEEEVNLLAEDFPEKEDEDVIEEPKSIDDLVEIESDDPKEKKAKPKPEKTEAEEFYYENEDLLEAYIGEDYKIIKKWPFNIWAFLLNWMYFLYRKLYITGGIGLIITWLLIVSLKNNAWIVLLIIMIALGLVFNWYYIFIAKRRVEKIMDEMDGSDRFTLCNICAEKGGVNVVFALIIYAIFLVLVFFGVVTINVNKHHNMKYWEENSENKANCNSLIKVAFQKTQQYYELGTPSEATCRVVKKSSKEYKIYIKSTKDNKTIFSYYETEKKDLLYKNNTTKLESLSLKKANSSLTPEESTLYNSLKKIESEYQEVYNKSKVEDQLIDQKKNTEEKLNYIFSREEIIR